MFNALKLMRKSFSILRQKAVSTSATNPKHRVTKCLTAVAVFVVAWSIHLGIHSIISMKGYMPLH